MESIAAKRGDTDIDAHLLCWKCQALPLDPKMCVDCQIMVCSVCGDQECLKCSKTLVVGPLFLSKNIKIHCKYREAGCLETLMPKEMREHERECIDKPKEVLKSVVEERKILECVVRRMEEIEERMKANKRDIEESEKDNEKVKERTDNIERRMEKLEKENEDLKKRVEESLSENELKINKIEENVSVNRRKISILEEEINLNFKS